MISNITLNWPAVIEFGSGKIETLKEHLKGHRRVLFLLDGPLQQKIAPLISELSKLKVEAKVSTDVVPEPPIEVLQSLLDGLEDYYPEAIVGIGGGSTMDLAKLLAVLLNSSQKIEQIIGSNNVLTRKIKLITASTTSGTGSEVTPIAVLTDTIEKLKKGVVSKYLIPDVAIVDPDLTLTLPPNITASTGMDAMTHCVEAYTNKFSHPIIDNIALEGIKLIAESLERAFEFGEDLKARASLALGSLYGGLCLGPVNTAAVHAMAYPLGGEFKVPHGVANSVLLPFVMNYNFKNCIDKYAQIAEKIGIKNDGNAEVMAKKAILRIRDISEKCQIPKSIKELDIPESKIQFMAESAMKVVRLMNNNPRTVNLEDAVKIYNLAYQGEMELEE